jgi:hypothetical protein
VSRVYAYCLSDKAGIESLQDVTGLEHSPPWILDCGSIRAVVGTLREDSAPVTRDNVKAHERVVEQVLQSHTPLPFRFGTIVSPDQLESFILKREASLMEMLDRVRGCVEMNVKILRIAVEPEISSTPLSGDEPGPGPGTSFLNRKLQSLKPSPEVAATAHELAAWLGDRIGDAVRDAALRLNPTHHMILAAAYMVEKPNIGTYRARVAQARIENRSLRFLSSGPWPPYSFVTIGP